MNSFLVAADQLRANLAGSSFARNNDGYDTAIAGFNSMIVHTPDIIVVAETESDVVSAVRFARDHRLSVHLHATGHGATEPIESGMVLDTSRLNALTIDPAARRATLGAGVRWGDVVTAAGQHGLAPVAGSALSVGAVGYTLGGGLGPLARSHGFTADWVRGFRVVAANGDVLTANSETNPDLFWALRGGKGGLAVVTEMTLELASLRTLYGGSIFFDESHIEDAFRAWIDWSSALPETATTSVALLRIPDVDGPPLALRGRRLLNVRFAFPGPQEEGSVLFSRMRAAAPAYLDFVDEMPADAIGSVHNDPDQGGPTWARGYMLDSFDHVAGEKILALVGPRSDSPFVAVELRQMGGATLTDTAEGTAVGGRESSYALAVLAADPATFERKAPDRAADIAAALSDIVSPVTNVNWVPGFTAADLDRMWPEDIRSRLVSVRQKWDPRGALVFVH